ncbi:MAG: histidine--tRNA ligase, partial [bacterium]
EPRTLKGFRDFLPEAAIRRQQIIQTIIATYESFGYVPLETPALEYADVLTGKYGEEGEKLMYRFWDNGKREVALRYDLTVPLARVVAQYPELSKPFRRYQIAPVWRAENTQKGRFREFTQCDIDVAGTTSMVADAEVAEVIATVLKNLGFSRFEVRINNRKILNGMLAAAEVPSDQTMPTLRALDKWLKIGADGVRSELKELLSADMIDKLFALLPQKDEPFLAWRARAEKSISTSTIGAEGLTELEEVRTLLSVSAFPEATFRFDPLLARGLDYYTGTIYEATLLDKPEIGSVYGGGRYDKLIGQFIGRDVPATGASAGVDRILSAMEELNMSASRAATADVLVLMMEKSLETDAWRIASELRAAGIKTELFSEAIKMDKQLKYADKLGIPFVVIFGSQEKEQGIVTIKELATKKQQKVKREELVSAVGGIVKK